MESLSERKQNILRWVIESFIKSAVPVGSKRLLDMATMSFSPATIRHEMNELEQLGYITHPHTSAGRIPTDKGYRYYVDHLMPEEQELSLQAEQAIMLLKQNMKTIDAFLEAASRIISAFTNQIGIVVFPELESLRFRSVNLIALSSQRTLVVWATMSGVIREQIVSFDHPVNEPKLKKIENFLNQEFTGMPFQVMQEQLRHRRQEIEDSYHELYQLAERVISNAFSTEQGKKRVWIGGLKQVLEYPEFQQTDRMHTLLGLLEEPDYIAGLLDKENPGEDVSIIIGSENATPYLWDYSLVSRNYVIQNDAMRGTLSILGPKRMDYAALVGVLNRMSSLISETFRNQA